MANTPTLGLPLLDPAQAQKHVTVNEALTLIDGLVQLSLISQSLMSPPASPTEGDGYLVPAGAVNEWSGHAGEIALSANGGWIFVAPRTGWHAWIGDEAVSVTFDGSGWQLGVAAMSPNGAATGMRVLEFDHVVSAGSSNSTVGLIPAKAMVFGVTARVTSALTGSLTSWTLGVAGSESRYGSGLGLGQGSFAEGITSAPTTHYTAEPLVLTGTGGDFSGGSVRFAVHYLALTPPNA